MSPPARPAGDFLAASAAAGVKVLAWAAAAAVVFRGYGEAAFAVLAVARATLGVLQYAAFGLAPAVVREVARDASDGAARAALRQGLVLTAALGVPAGVAAWAYAAGFTSVHAVAPPLDASAGTLAVFALLLAAGVWLRLAADTAGAATQARGRVAADQAAAASGDVAWVVMLAGVWSYGPTDAAVGLAWVAGTYAASGVVMLAARAALAWRSTAGGGVIRSHGLRLRMLASGWFITLGSLADFLYAPVDYVVLNRLVDPLAPAVYAPAQQVDAALFVVASAAATVALPRVARSAAARDAAGVWRAYVRGSVLAGGVALAVAIAAWASASWVFAVWLGDDLPATRVILPLVLAHTVMGSAAGVGRAALLALGRPGLYAGVVLAGGLLNVVLSVAFALAGWGIAGVVLATVISVGVRCVAVLPWLVRREARRLSDGVGVSVVAAS